MSKLFTIKDLADGKCRLHFNKNVDSFELLCNVIKKAAPKDETIPENSVEYIECKDGFWFSCTESDKDTPTQSIHLFDLKENVGTHETFVIGFDKEGSVVFLKSYTYLQQKEEAQSDLKWVIGNCNSWQLSAMTEWRLSHVELGKVVSDHKIVIQHP